MEPIFEAVLANDPSVVSAEELSRAQGIPHGFLQGILADLRRAGVLASQRGQSGGWRLAVWRVALVLLMPVAAFTWLILWLIDVGVTCYALLATVIYLTAERLLSRPEWLC